MDKNIQLTREEAALHADKDGYLTYITQFGEASFHMDTPYAHNGWWGQTFFRTETGLFNTVLDGGFGQVAVLKMRGQPVPVIDRNEFVSDDAADHAFMLAINGTISPEVA